MPSWDIVHNQTKKGEVTISAGATRRCEAHANLEGEERVSVRLEVRHFLERGRRRVRAEGRREAVPAGIGGCHGGGDGVGGSVGVRGGVRGSVSSGDGGSVGGGDGGGVRGWPTGPHQLREVRAEIERSRDRINGTRCRCTGIIARLVGRYRGGCGVFARLLAPNLRASKEVKQKHAVSGKQNSMHFIVQVYNKG